MVRSFASATALAVDDPVELAERQRPRAASRCLSSLQSGKGHVVSRNADNPNEVFVRVEFASVDDARAFRERLLASGALDRAGSTVKMGPTVIEPVETVTY